jgi:predicted DNA-binding transcriptional regulator YafY
MSIIIQLQSRRIVQARDLAQRFDVSLRTIYRDIRALENAGLPITSETGRGYSLVEGYHLPPVMFTPQEIGALLLAERTAGLFNDLASQASLTSALTKVQAVLKEAQKDWASSVADHMSVFDLNFGATNPDMHTLQNALHEKKALAIRYRSVNGNTVSQRTVEPVHIYFAGLYGYLVAFCQLRQDYRIFRIDHIEDMQPIQTSFTLTHPPIEDILNRMLESKAGHKVVLRFAAQADWENFRNYLLPGCVLKTENGEGGTEVTLWVDSLPVLGKWLVESAYAYEIVQPEELRAAAHQYALEKADSYRQRAEALK